MARGLSRREALEAGAGALVIAVAGCGDEKKQRPEPEPPKPPVWRPAGPVEGLTADSFTLRRKRDVPQLPHIPFGVYLRLENDGPEARVLAVGNRCTHKGCPVRYVEGSRKFICPCHGAVFNRRGDVEGGPAPRALERFETRVYNGTVYVKNTTI
jgi:Rieske Fe-S protein